MMLSEITALCDAVVALMQPLVEIVIHDVPSDRIVYINGGLSRRKTGDPSLLSAADLQPDQLNTLIYSKLNFDGRLVKSISIPIEKNWIVCMNADISVFSQLHQLTQTFLKVEAEQPDSLFKNDWQEQLHVVIHKYLSEQGWSFNTLTTAQKKILVKYIWDNGGFQQKHAATYVARLLSVSRATMFNYLKQWR